MTTLKHALLRMIEVHNLTDTTYPSFSITSHQTPSGSWLAIEGSQGEIFAALSTALMNASAMSEADRADIKRAMYEAKLTNIGPRTSDLYFPGVPFPQAAPRGLACGTCERCLFGEQCDLIG